MKTNQKHEKPWNYLDHENQMQKKHLANLKTDFPEKVISKNNLSYIAGSYLPCLHSHVNTRPNMSNMAKYEFLCAYMGALNMVKWGVPEKILQNIVPTRCS